MGDIFIVTSGEYSDYGISAVFSTRELAEEYVQRNGSDYRVEEYPLDPLDDRTDNVLWNVLMKIENHNVLSCRRIGKFEYVDCGNCVRYVIAHSGECLSFNLRADTMDRAIKVANERMNQVLCGRDMFYRKVFIKVKGYFGMGYPIVDYDTGEII